MRTYALRVLVVVVTPSVAHASYIDGFAGTVVLFFAIPIGFILLSLISAANDAGVFRDASARAWCRVLVFLFSLVPLALVGRANDNLSSMTTGVFAVVFFLSALRLTEPRRDRASSVTIQNSNGLGDTSFEFRASCVVLENPQGDSVFLGLAERPVDPVKYLIMKRVVEPSSAGVKQENVGYYVEFCRELNSGHGGVKKARLCATSLVLEFDEVGMKYLDGIGVLAVYFRTDNAKFERMQEVVKGIFEGGGCELRIDA